MKERVEHAKIRAVMQGIINKEKGPEVFEEYMKTAFPWIETAKGREKVEHIKQLMEEIKRGAISVNKVPGADRKAKSRMRERIEVERPKAPAVPRNLNRFYEKLKKNDPRH